VPGKYLRAVMSELPELNGWSIACHAGDRRPDKTQRLLNHASWDTFAAMGVVRRFAAAGLAEAARKGRHRRGHLVIGAVDETGQEKAGAATAGVKRQYLGCAGRVANGINTVHLAYVQEKTGHALTGARQWIPAEQVRDPARSLAAGLPPGLAFRTKGQIAIDLCAEAHAGGLAFDFICGDEVYGGCTEEGFEFGKDAFGLDHCQARLYTAIARHLVLVMAALAVCAVTAALMKNRTDTQPPPPVSPGQAPPAGPGMIPLTVPEIKRTLAALTTRPRSPGHVMHSRRRMGYGRAS